MKGLHFVLSTLDRLEIYSKIGYFEAVLLPVDTAAQCVTVLALLGARAPLHHLKGRPTG